MRKTLKQKFDEANKQGINVPSELISNDDIVGVYGFFACGDGCSYVPIELYETSAETKATYDEIKKYVAEHNAGMKVSNLYISQVKRKCGIEVGKNYNLPKNEDSRQP